MRLWFALVEGLHDSADKMKRWDESEDQKATQQISVWSVTHRQPLMVNTLSLLLPFWYLKGQMSLLGARWDSVYKNMMASV